MVIPNEILLGEISELLAKGSEVELKAKGSSMLPFIRDGRDSVRLIRSEDPLKEGDAVLAEITPGHYVLHRIVSIEGDRITLKGDGNLRGTEHCRVGDIKGKAVSIVRPDGKVTDCAGEKALRRAAKWNSLPYFIRRICLAILHRYYRYENRRRIQNQKTGGRMDRSA